MNRVSPELEARLIALVWRLEALPESSKIGQCFAAIGLDTEIALLASELPAPVDPDREVVRRILARYHQTRMADVDPIDFILASSEVKAALARQESPQ